MIFSKEQGYHANDVFLSRDFLFNDGEVEVFLKAQNFSIRKNNLIFGLKVDLPGLKTFSKFSEIYFFWIFFFHELNSIKPTIIKGIMKSI